MHWRNSEFQVAHFLVGKCHTADGAYRLACELREERDVAIRSSDATAKRQQAKRLRAEKAIVEARLVGDEIAILDAEADLGEIDAFAEQQAACYAMAVREREFLYRIIAALQPHRQFASLPDHEAHQACQAEEWRLELKRRAENYLMAQGGIPADHLETMRLHPAWESIRAHIGLVQERIKQGVPPERHLPAFAQALPDPDQGALPLERVHGPH